MLLSYLYMLLPLSWNQAHGSFRCLSVLDQNVGLAPNISCWKHFSQCFAITVQLTSTQTGKRPFGFCRLSPQFFTYIFADCAILRTCELARALTLASKNAPSAKKQAMPPILSQWNESFLCLSVLDLTCCWISARSVVEIFFFYFFTMLRRHSSVNKHTNK